MSFFKNNIWLSRAQNLGLSTFELIVLISLSLIATLTEVIGIGIFLPIFQFIRLEGDIDALVLSSNFWEYAISIFNYLGLQISLVPILLTAFLIFVIRQIIIYIRLIYTQAIKQRIVQSQRKNVFESYIDSSVSYQDKHPVGNLLNIVLKEVDRAVAGVMTPLEFIVYIIMLTGYLLLLSIMSWEMTLLSVIVLLIVSTLPRVWIRKSTDTGRRLVDVNTQISEFLMARLRLPRLIRLSGTEAVEKDAFDKLTLRHRKNTLINTILQTKTMTVMEPVIVGLSLIFLYISYSLLNLQVEIIGLYLVIAMRLIPLVKTILMQIQSMQSLLGSVEILEKSIKETKDNKEIDNGKIKISKINDSIVFESVSFSYKNDGNYALKDISMTIKPFGINAIVGPSGGGKSTLIDLLPYLRTPSNGKIQFDGKDIEEYKLSSLRQLISYAPQTPQIFNCTVKEHILYSNSFATFEEVKKAAYLSGSDEFINKLPNGYDTMIGDDGAHLSGGQRQRLDMARVLLRNSKIMILDEPTSNLDAKSESVFNEALLRIKDETDITIIIISHRLDSISNADNIFVLNQGRMESKGTHQELIKQEGWYADAWQLQSVSVDKLK
jgi:ABC-type multidrug transport system fused ATPase/permease subunit